MRYRIDRPLVIDNLSLTIPRGTTNALCGRSGCGKTSVFSILASLYPIQRGLVTIEGKTISSKRNARTIREHRQLVSVLSQDPLLFVGTVRENLLGPGTPERDDSDIWEALQQVGLSGKIAAMEQKLDAPVEEGGSIFVRRKAAILHRSLASIAQIHSSMR